MKKLFFTSLLLSGTIVSIAQVSNSYFGVKLGMNASTISYSPDINGFNSKTKTAFAGGVYYNIGLGRAFSIQPELLYSSMGTKVEQTLTSPKGEGKLNLNYISVPVLFKILPVWRLGFFVGPQFDFLASANSTAGSQAKINQKDNIKGFDFAGTAGVEIWITQNIGLYGRYILGVNNADKVPGNNITVPIYPPITSPLVTSIKNRGWQFGLTIGFRGKVKPPPAPPAPAVAVIVDTDNDGIPDASDKCPDKTGTAKYNGCPIPDTDNDGINDENDKCPSVAGLPKYNGCPIPDTDNDDVNDENDKCPSVAGLPKYNGCPIPDTDKDGINDEADKCPNVAGIAENLGCPEMIFYYKRAVASLSAEDKANLDRVVAFLEKNPAISIVIEGHTSTLGTTAFNQKLSEQRASNSVKYLVSKGIDAARLKAAGYGEQFPIGDNSKEEGRAQSRRVVIKIAQ